MNELFNWGGETPEQRQARLQQEHELLLEQARMRFNMMAMTGGAAGGGGAPSGGNDPAPQAGGLTITGDLFDGAITKIFLSEIGTENGKPLYAVSFSVNDRGREFNVWLKVAWNSSSSLWEFSQIFSGDGEIDGFVYATSPDLYNDEWTPTEDGPPIETSPGEEYADDWKYCVTTDASVFGFTSTGSYQASWFGIPLTEPPNVYLSGGFEGASGSIPFFWDTDSSIWVVGFPGRSNLGSLGGTRDALPTGTFNLEIEGEVLTITINSGVCEVEPLPVPAPPIPPSTVPFIIRVDTTSGDGNDYYTVPTKSGLTYNYDVTWSEVGNPGNSGTVTGQTGEATINFPSSGEYDLSIIGVFPAIFSDFSGDCQKLTDIIQWGDVQWQSMDYAFAGCSNLNLYSASDTPDLSSVTDLSYMFGQATQFNGDISDWDVSNVTDMDGMLSGAQAFNQDISGWDVSSVTNMQSMFSSATQFNGDISGWNVSSVQSMGGMFQGATQFNGDLSLWDVSSVTSMDNMFNNADSFNQNISGWNVSNVQSMSAMFRNATQFNGDISGWDVSNVTYMTQMFYLATSFNQDISGWDVSSVTSMEYMFANASQFNGDISGWNVSNVQSMSAMFSQAIQFNGDISGWNVSNVTVMNYMFYDANSFNQDLSGWNVSNVNFMEGMFQSASSFNQDLSGWCVSLIPVEPFAFADKATAWVQPKPVWGTCP